MLTRCRRVNKNVSRCSDIGNRLKRCLKDTQLHSARLRDILVPLAPPGDRAVQEKRARDAKTHIQSFERHSKLHYGRRRARDAAAARAAVASTASYTQLRRRRVSPLLRTSPRALETQTNPLSTPRAAKYRGKRASTRLALPPPSRSLISRYSKLARVTHHHSSPTLITYHHKTITMMRTTLLAMALVPLALGDYSYSFTDAPTAAPTAETMSPTASMAPTRTETRRHSRITLTVRQNTPAIDAAIYYPDSTLYQLQPSFHTKSTEPEPTARARRAGEEFY